jgi:hypothetical protein
MRTPATASEMPDFDRPAWTDQDEEEVRPYAVTGGRTHPRHTMRLVSLLAAGRIKPSAALTPEAECALGLCRAAQRSVAEIASHLGQPVQVTKVVLSDLIDSGVLVMAVPDTPSEPHKDPQLLEAVLAGLQRKFSNVA